MALSLRGVRTVVITCPFCDHEHSHGWPPSAAVPGSRVAHCGRGTYRITRPAAGDPTDTALRCAWLRGNAKQASAIDPTGQLAAQLRDFADLLEVAQQRGWLA